jgi:hypothetical protein
MRQMRAAPIHGQARCLPVLTIVALWTAWVMLFQRLNSCVDNVRKPPQVFTFIGTTFAETNDVLLFRLPDGESEGNTLDGNPVFL